MSTLKKNLFFQTLYKVVLSIAPLLTTPYLSRVLGPESLGVFSYRQSIVNFFVLFAMLGTSTYGVRMLASVKNDRQEVSKTFLSIYSFQLLTSLITILAYCIFLLCINDNYLIVSWIFICYLIGAAFDTTWFFFGIEEINIVSLRGIIVKLLSLFSVFFLVKKPDDLPIYAAIVAGGTALGQIIVIPALIKRISFVKIAFSDVTKHIKPNLILFIPIAAVTIYHVMDKIMLGWFSSDYESGCYYNADKVINIPIGIITGVHSVFLPRITNSLVTDDFSKTDKMHNDCFTITLFLSCSMALGIAAVSHEFVPLFFGDGYEKCIYLIMWFAIIMIIKSLSSMTKNIYLIPTHNDKTYLFSVLLGVVVNLVSNVIFIYLLKMGSLGAVLGTLLAELSVLVVELCVIAFKNPEFHVFKNLVKGWPFAVSGAVMLVFIYMFRMFTIDFLNVYIMLLLEIVVGIVTYFGATAIYFKAKKMSLISVLKGIK